jgi:hypothetical protein
MVGTRVMKTHSPCNVQNLKKVAGSTLARSKRLSPPSLMTRMKRKVPSLQAQANTR